MRIRTGDNQNQRKHLTEKEKSFTLLRVGKPLIGRSNLLKHLKRAAGGGIAVMGRLANGPVRAN